MNRCLIVAVCLIACCWPLAKGGADETSDQFYRDQIKPVLRSKCFGCHGPLKQEAGLRLDSGELIRQGSDGGSIIDTINVDDSLILQRVTSDDEFERMPPEGHPLTQKQIEAIRKWIRGGAKYPVDDVAPSTPREHWAFQPLSDVAPPRNDSANPIDAFVRHQLDQHQMDLSPPAPAHVLVRRMFLDLHGLPPRVEQQEYWTGRFTDDRKAVTDLIDELLDSPRYGERWAQHWLDVVRYADTHGFEVNTPRPHAWRYRDYVIRAFNDDKPYDEFVFEQLAGDSVNQDAATGFWSRLPCCCPVRSARMMPPNVWRGKTRWTR